MTAFQYIIPSLGVESQPQYKTPHKLNFTRIVLAEPFLEAPFQPPRLA
ncbi:hypothetical protein K2P97_08470 [bacterium]|nr:hypothetical protein [bacterium]